MPSSPHLGTKTRFLLLSDNCMFVNVGSPLWQDDGSVVYNRCWPSPALSFSGSSPAELRTAHYCLRFETSTTWRVMFQHLYPPETGWPSYTTRHWVPFSSSFTTRGATMEVFEPASTLAWWSCQSQSQSQSQSHIATDGQSWCRAPSGAHDQIFITVCQLRSCFWGTPSLTRGRVCLLSESLSAVVSHLS
jgi:hypothetical protein